MLPDWTVVGFTGHRNLADPNATARLIGGVLDAVQARAKGNLVAISSLAKGSDTLFVEEVARRKIPFLLVLPFLPKRFQKDFSPEEWRRAEPFLKQAQHVEEIRGVDSDQEAYMEAGVRVVDYSDVLIGVWDGKATAGFGGTGDVVAYAKALGRPFEWLNPVTGRVASDQIDKVAAVAASNGWNGKPYQTVEAHFRELDDSASLRAPKVRHLIQRIVLLHLIASAAGLTALALGIHGLAGYAIALLEVGVLASAFLFTTMHHRRHMEWMTTRIEAEICRSFLALWPMRARLDRSPRLTLRGFERLVRNLRLLQQMDGGSPSMEIACREYLEQRVQNQIGYFTRQSEQARRAYRTLKGLAITSTGAATLLGAAHFVLSLLHIEGPAATATGLLSLILPLASAALLSLILTQEHSRRAHRYQEMAATLNDAATRLKAARTWNGLTRIALEVEEQLLNEAAEWQSFRRFASEPH